MMELAGGRGRLLLLSHEGGGRLSLHHADSLKRLKSFAGQHPAGRGCVAVAPAAGLLLTAAREKTQLCYWRLAEKEPFLRVSAAERLTALAVTADGNFSFAGTQSGQLLVHNLLTGALLGALRTAGREVAALALSPDGGLLAVAAEEVRVVRVWALLAALNAGRDASALAEAELYRWSRGTERVVALEFPPLAADALVVAAEDRTLSLVAADGRTARVFALEERPTCLCSSPGGELLAAGLGSGRLALARPRNEAEEVGYVQICSTTINAVAWNGDKETLLVAGGDKTLYAVSPAGAVIAREALLDGSALNLLSLPFNEQFLTGHAARPREADDPQPPAKLVLPAPQPSLLVLSNPRPRTHTPIDATLDPSAFLALFSAQVLARSGTTPTEPTAPAAEPAPDDHLRAANHRLLCKVVEMERELGLFKR